MSYEECAHGKSCGYDICPGEECEHFEALTEQDELDNGKKLIRRALMLLHDVCERGFDPIGGCAKKCCYWEECAALDDFLPITIRIPDDWRVNHDN